MTTADRCPHCGTERTPGTPLGLCPACLLKAGLAAPTDGPPMDAGSGDGESPTYEVRTASQPERGAAFGAPEHVGPYHIQGVLGEGGMGIVYLAEQREPIARRVALKLVKPGMDSREVLRRFEAERQALALMDHPHIARVLDAGIGPGGTPYFVMEYVPGLTITDYCDRHRLTNTERLELFLPVCAAIQHAHQKGVIHRDLKPSNILVTVQDGKPVPKVIDFGIAKATHQGVVERAAFTELGMLIGTPEYMSPEQAEASGLEVDTTTDIYSLGVILYELLVGALPFDPVALRQAGITEIHRIIREQDPPKPSMRASTLGATAEEVAKRHQTNPGGLARQVRGDLDAITMKALEKDRTRRYASASEFAADLQRYLHGEAVVARPASVVYRTRKFVRRHKVGVAAAAMVLLALAAGVVTTSLMYARSEEARREQERQRAIAERQSYLANVLAADASLQGGNVNDASQRLEAAPSALRGWEWRFLAGRADASVASVTVDGRVAELADDGSTVVARILRMGPEADFLFAAGPRSLARAPAKGAPPTGLVAAALMGLQTGTPRTVGGGFEIALSADGRLAAVAPWRSTGLTMKRDGLFATASDMADSRRDLVQVVETAGARVLHELRLGDAGTWTGTVQKGSGFGRNPTEGLAGLVDLSNGSFTRLMSGVMPHVVAAAFDPRATRLATWSWSNRIQVWDVRTGARLAAFAGHLDRINAVAFTADGARLASASRDGTVRLYSIAGQTQTGTIRIGEPVRTVAFADDGRLMATGGSDGAVTAWDATSLRSVWSGRHDAQVDTVSFSRDGRILISGSRDRSVRLWRASDGLPLTRLRGHSGWVQVVSSRTSGDVVTGGADGTVRLWTPAESPVWICGRHEDLVYSVAGASEAAGLFSSSADGTIRAWQLGAAGALRAWEGASPRAGGVLRIPFTKSDIYALAVSPDGRVLASGAEDNVVRLWSTADGTAGLELKGHEKEVASLAFSPRGDVLLSASADNTLRAWNPKTGATLAIVKADTSDEIRRAAFSGDGRYIVALTKAGVRSWRADSFAADSTVQLENVDDGSLAASPTDDRVAVGTADGRVLVVARDQRRVLKTLSAGGNAVITVAFSPDGTRLLAGSIDGALRLYDARTFDRVLVVSGTAFPDLGDVGPSALPASRSFVTEFFLGGLPRVFPTAAAFSRDGDRVLSGWSDGTVRVLTARSGR